MGRAKLEGRRGRISIWTGEENSLLQNRKDNCHGCFRLTGVYQVPERSLRKEIGIDTLR